MTNKAPIVELKSTICGKSPFIIERNYENERHWQIHVLSFGFRG